MTGKLVSHWRMISVYSFTHFLIDFACAFLIFRNVSGTPDGALCILIYNFCAFAMQMPIGIIADRANRNSDFAIAGCFFVAAAFGLRSVPLAATVIVGIGNAMFHIGGGIDILNISEKKLGALGIFVSPGAFGIYYGGICGRGSSDIALFIPMVLIVAAGLIFVANRPVRKGINPQNAEFSLTGVDSGKAVVAIACFFLVVCLRSFVGLTLNFPWKGTGHWGIALLCAVVFGKASGGFAADGFGLRRTVTFSLSSAALLFLLAGTVGGLPFAGIAGVAAVLLFNMTMPITLWAMVKVLPNAKGFAFGILTFGLFIGFLPPYLGLTVSPDDIWLFALLTAVSRGVLLFGLHKVKEKI